MYINKHIYIMIYVYTLDIEGLLRFIIRRVHPSNYEAN